MTRALEPWRLLHIFGLTAVASAVVGFAALFIQPPAGALLSAIAPLGPIALSRDLLAYTGLALTTAALIGPALARLLPLAWAILPVAVLRPSQPDPTGLLRLPAQPDDAVIPLIVAIAVSSSARRSLPTRRAFPVGGHEAVDRATPSQQPAADTDHSYLSSRSSFIRAATAA